LPNPLLNEKIEKQKTSSISAKQSKGLKTEKQTFSLNRLINQGNTSSALIGHICNTNPQNNSKSNTYGNTKT
jgi:hypothetical protein